MLTHLDKQKVAKANLASNDVLPIGFATVLSSEPNPEIMLAIDFRGRFCATFWTSKK